MAEVMEPQAGEICPSRDRLPRLVKIGARLIRIVARDDVGAKARQRAQDLERGRVQDDGFLAGLRGRKEQKSPLEIDVVPLQIEDLA